MTQEQKAKAYDKAIEKIKYVMEHGVSPVLNKEDLQDIFPELAESDDDRIRKELLESFKYQQRESRTDKEWLNGIKLSEVVAWLEKQGEQNFPILSNSAKTGKNWSEEDEKCIDNCCLLIGAADNCYEKTFKDDCIHYLQSLKERMGI